jgi:hypothetical protein
MDFLLHIHLDCVSVIIMFPSCIFGSTYFALASRLKQAEWSEEIVSKKLESLDTSDQGCLLATLVECNYAVLAVACPRNQGGSHLKFSSLEAKSQNEQAAISSAHDVRMSNQSLWLVPATGFPRLAMTKGFASFQTWHRDPKPQSGISSWFSFWPSGRLGLRQLLRFPGRNYYQSPVEELVVSDCRGKKEFLCRFRNGFVAFVVLDHSNFYNNNQC